LRQPPRLAFASIALTGFAARSPLASELREQLGRQVRVLEAPDKADVVLHALEDQRDRSAVASTATAEVRELQRELIPVTQLAAGRSMSYRETAALAKEFEQAELYREMQTDVVAQVMRRLAAISL
jgi:LPS-assembly lipoprotein